MKQLSISYTHAWLVSQGRDVKIKRAMWYMYLVKKGRKEVGGEREKREEEQKAWQEGRGEGRKEGRDRQCDKVKG